MRGFIETCGRHPFATGLFALLGLIGLIFSFVTFGVDRVQSQQQAIETAEIKSSLSRMEGSVRNIPVAMEEPEDFDPIETDFGEVTRYRDNVSFDRAHMDRSKAWIDSNIGSSFGSIPFLPFSVKSRADKEFVQIAPYILIEVVEVETVAPKLAAIYEGERGGAEVLRSFQAALLPEVGRQFAPLVDDATNELRTDVDYFSLMPGEPEEFFLGMMELPGYVYTIRIGLHYKYKGRHRIHWVAEGLRLGTPDYPLPVTTRDSDGYKIAFHPDFDVVDNDEFRREAGINAAAAMAGKVFRPSQLPQYSPPN